MKIIKVISWFVVGLALSTLLLTYWAEEALTPPPSWQHWRHGREGKVARQRVAGYSNYYAVMFSGGIVTAIVRQGDRHEVWLQYPRDDDGPLTCVVYVESFGCVDEGR